MKHKKKNKQELQVEVREKPIMVDGVEVTPSQKVALDAITLLDTYGVDDDNVIEKLSNNGWEMITDEINTISGIALEPVGNPAFAGFIPGVAYGFNADYTKVKTAPAMIANTIDYGLVYTAPGENGKGTEVIGPVINPCIIGNTDTDKASAILIPFAGGVEAMKAGRQMIDSFIDADLLDNGNKSYSSEDCEHDCECHCLECDKDQGIPDFDFSGCEKMW